MTAIEEHMAIVEPTFSGALIRPDDARYDGARACHNGLIDKRPALIARCHGSADIVDAIRLARETGLEISVRGGGHNVAGRAVTEGGLMIDLAEMKGIYVHPEARTVRAQGGVTWAELNRETALHGLAVTGGQVSTTGIAGFTLGGGLGWLMGLYGLVVDNLLSVELVTAEGEVLQASTDSHPDLFWALRGGGGNFGVAASLEYRLHPLADVTGGLLAYPIDAAADVMRFYRDFTRQAPDELTMHCALVHAPDGSGLKLAALVICHAGSPADAERDLAPVRAFREPMVDMLGRIPYPAVNSMLDAGYPRGALGYWKSSFLSDLSDGLIDAALEQFLTTPSIMNAILIEQYHGAATRVPVDATAVANREEGYNLLLPSTWLDPEDTEANIAWTRAAYEAFTPWFRQGRWLNYFADDEGMDATRAVYGPNYDRLVEVKRRHDPENVFHLNVNIDPGA